MSNVPPSHADTTFVASSTPAGEVRRLGSNHKGCIRCGFHHKHTPSTQKGNETTEMDKLILRKLRQSTKRRILCFADTVLYSGSKCRAAGSGGFTFSSSTEKHHTLVSLFVWNYDGA
eukprot:4264287-Amphidinium_carterae.1